MASKILITGSTGFVGTHLVPALRRKWPNAQLLGLGRQAPAVTADGIETRQVDIMDATAVDGCLAEFEPDLIYHLAAQSSVARGLSTAGPTWTVNLSGSLSVALAIAHHVPDATLVFASTSEVYGAAFLGSPVDEAVAPQPLNDYAKSKLVAEQMFANVLPPSCRLIVTRAFNHTGPGQRDEFVLPSFARQVARIEAGIQAPCLETGNLDVRRDFLDVRDVAAAYVALGAAAAALPRRLLVNISSGSPRLLRDLLVELQNQSRRPFTLEVDPARLRPVDVPLAFAYPCLLRALTDWAPVHAIEETLTDVLNDARQRI